MNTEVTRETKLITKVHGKVSGVKTITNLDCAINSLLQEGVPEDAVIGLYADGNHSIQVSQSVDQTEQLREVRDMIVSYFEAMIEDEDRCGYKAERERVILNQVNAILGSL